jgi:hypothetical protein
MTKWVIDYLLNLIFEPSFSCGKFLFYLPSLRSDAPWIVFIGLLPLLLSLFLGTFKCFFVRYLPFLEGSTSSI